jgi:membrane fusion protein, heavy metal efflux system
MIRWVTSIKKMKKIILVGVLLAFTHLSCKQEVETESHDHDHDHELEALSFTRYTDKTELFVEFKPLVVGEESKFAAHFTALGEQFKAIAVGKITLSLEVGGKSTRMVAASPSNPGIFRLALKAPAVGVGRLVFDIETPDFTDRIQIDSVVVYPDAHAAIAAQGPEAGEDNITYLKEQAWKVEFANTPARRQAFSDVIRTSGKILSAPGDEALVTANAAGVLHFAGGQTSIGAEVAAGALLFKVAGGNLVIGNLDASYKEAKASLDKAKVDLDRATALVQDRLISEKEFRDVQLRHEMAQIAFGTLARSYSTGGQTITAPMGGFLKNILVTEGQRVEPGMPLATISKNQKLILEVALSQRHFHLLPAIQTAHVKALRGDGAADSTWVAKLVSFGRSTGTDAPFVPLIFEVNNTGSLVPGSVVEVFVKTAPIPDALVIPVSALIEEQGVFFAFVQVGGESFQKRELRLGGQDGQSVQVLAGLQEGERVVSRGAYQIRLTMASGTLPAHGHAH